MNLQADATQRAGIYRRIEARNRVVAILRIGVPALGSIVLAALLVQIYVSSLGSRFGIGQIAVTRDSIVVEAPEYAGLLDDGSAYRVWAADAKAAIDATDLINLTDAALTLDRPTGITMQATAPSALLDTTRQLVVIEGVAYVEDTTGTSGTFHQSVFDWSNQVLDAKGPVHVDYADGAKVDAESLVYDSKSQVWTFSRATVTLPATPGEEPAESLTP
jgi:lipopolysaccharide export system protein LptC